MWLCILNLKHMTDIQLIPLERGDIELVRQWRNNPEVYSYMYTEGGISEEQQEKWFERISADTSSIYWIIEYGGKKMGLASVNDINHTLQSCYWAFYLGEVGSRNAGIGAKVEYHVIRYVFEELKLNKLRCEVFVSNNKVIIMHEKFGFRREAYYREHCVKNNAKLDVVGLAILKSEWLMLRDKLQSKIYGQ